MQQDFSAVLCRCLFPLPNHSFMNFILAFSAPASASNHKAGSGIKPKVALDPHIRLKDGKLELVSGMGLSPQSEISSQPSPKVCYAEDNPLV